MKTTIRGASDRAIRGSLVLLLVPSLSRVAINHQVTSIKQRHLESPAIAAPTISETQEAKKEEQNEER